MTSKSVRRTNGAVDSEMLKAAESLARVNARMDPSIKEIYLFPAKSEIRLITIDPLSIPTDRIVAFYFPADPEGRIRFPCGIADIRPQEKALKPPAGWGSWRKARKIWPKKSSHAR